MDHSQQIKNGDDKRMNLIIVAVTDLFDDVLEQVRMILKLSDPSMWRTVNNSLVERDSAIIDGSL